MAGQYDNITDMGLSFGDGNDNISGVAEQAFLIPISWIKTMAKATAALTSGSLVTISGNHLMIVGKAPIPVATLYDKSGITWKLAGEKLSKIFEQGVELFIPENSVKSLGTLAAVKNYRYILLIGKIDGSGTFWQIGSELISATITDIAGGSGIGPTGEVGSKVTLQSYATAPVYSYEGDVPPVGVAG